VHELAFKHPPNPMDDTFKRTMETRNPLRFLGADLIAFRTKVKGYAYPEPEYPIGYRLIRNDVLSRLAPKRIS
jgi:hypothetical protein